ncbi:autophagy protein Apg6 [Nitzschia inconspicua]|uniref:Autophagy protein Apg6 n=1 Tax=Nitzschia inconspicua TaxID=303405 RepID=A0A9K3KWA1_9STRA|nr:autophagy protein Apg6 [Nitzschia inconspicua]
MNPWKGSHHQKGQQEENDDLKARLESLRRRRRKLYHHQQQCLCHQQLLTERINRRRQNRQNAVEEYVGILTHRESLNHFLETAQRWNTVNDCFHIWVSGPFATINGCRLGSTAPPVPHDLTIDRSLLSTTTTTTTTTSQLQQQQPNDDPAMVKDPSEITSSSRVHTSQNNANTQIIGTTQQSASSSLPQQKIQTRYFGLFTSSSNSSDRNDQTTIQQGGTTVASAATVSNPPYMLETPRVPWLEVNAALGHACLLLKLIQELSTIRGNEPLVFSHELHPMAATSKIGIRFAANLGMINGGSGNGNGTKQTTKLKSISPVVYNLYFEEPSGFNIFKNNLKNFNFALQAFLQCLAEAAAQQTDKTIALPHTIEHVTSKKHFQANSATVHNFLNGGEWTIGGLSICYPSAAASATVQDPIGGGGGTQVNRFNYHHHHHSYNSGMDSPTIQWTKACKLLLTNLKWLVAYSARHYDR